MDVKKTICSSERNPFLTYVIRHIPPQICNALLQAFGVDGRVVSMLYRYAVEEILRGDLELSGCPALDAFAVYDAALILGKNTSCINVIREEGNIVTLRIILEILYRLGYIVPYSYICENDSDIRNCTCALIESFLLNAYFSELSEAHMYLFAYSIRGLLDKNKIPGPAIIRMQQLEYFLNPLSRLCYYNVSPIQGYKGSNRFKKLPLSIDPFNKISTQIPGFRKKLSEAFFKKFCELQKPSDMVQAEIKGKARVFEIIARLTERLFGSTPCLFGSGASGLATSASDMDVVVLQSRHLMRRLAFFSHFWKKCNQKDYCPFPSIIRIRRKLCHNKKGVFNFYQKTGLNGMGFNQNIFKVLEQRRSFYGEWKWLKRSTREIAAIWSGRILSSRLARFGWSVQCVESARVPIVRVIAAVDTEGNPQPILPDDLKMDVDKKNGVRLFCVSSHLDPVVTVSKPKTWDGFVTSRHKTKDACPVWQLSAKDRRRLNLLLQKNIDRYMEKIINSSEKDWGVDIKGNLKENYRLQADKKIIKVSTDISFNHEVVVHNTRLLKSYAEIEPSLIPLSILIKHWTKQRGVCDAYQGTLSSYQWMLMVIHYLQHYLTPVRIGCNPEKTVPLPILPNLQDPPPDLIKSYPLLVDDRYDIFFYHPQRGLSRPLFPPSCFSKAVNHNMSGSLNSKRNMGELQRSKNSQYANWPEDLYKDNPYEYAYNTLSFPSLNTKNTRSYNSLLNSSLSDSQKEINENILKRMCQHSNPIKGRNCFFSSSYSNKINSEQDFSPEMMENLKLQGFVTYGDKSLGSLFQEFFDYFGFRFNHYAYVVSINRTPKLPQKKNNYFTVSNPFGTSMTPRPSDQQRQTPNFSIINTPAKNIASCATNHETSFSKKNTSKGKTSSINNFVDDILMDSGNASSVSDNESHNYDSDDDMHRLTVLKKKKILLLESLNKDSLISSNTLYQLKVDEQKVDCCKTTIIQESQDQDISIHGEMGDSLPFQCFSDEVFKDNMGDSNSCILMEEKSQMCYSKNEAIKACETHSINCTTKTYINTHKELPLSKVEIVLKLLQKNSENNGTTTDSDDNNGINLNKSNSFIRKDLHEIEINTNEFKSEVFTVETRNSLDVNNQYNLNDNIISDSSCNSSGHDLPVDQHSQEQCIENIYNEVHSHLTENDGEITNKGASDASDSADSFSDTMVNSHMPDVTLDSLWGSDTEMSDMEFSETSEKKMNRLKYVEQKQKLLAYRVASSRSKYGLRLRPFLCILDPFETDRTIGPGHRDGFSQLVFELLRVRGILLEAERRFKLQPSSVKYNDIVNAIFRPVSSTKRNSQSLPNYYETSYHHLLSSQYVFYEKKYSSKICRVHEHLRQSINSLDYGLNQSKKCYVKRLSSSPEPLLFIRKKSSLVESTINNVLEHEKPSKKKKKKLESKKSFSKKKIHQSNSMEIFNNLKDSLSSPPRLFTSQKKILQRDKNNFKTSLHDSKSRPNLRKFPFELTKTPKRKS